MSKFSGALDRCPPFRGMCVIFKISKYKKFIYDFNKLLLIVKKTITSNRNFVTFKFVSTESVLILLKSMVEMGCCYTLHHKLTCYTCGITRR